MSDIHELAESLEKKRLALLKVNLSGFTIGGFTWILEFFLLPENSLLIWRVLQLLGAGIWLGSFIALLSISLKIRKNPELRQYFNDELNAYNRLKTWKAGFISVMLVLAIFFILSFFLELNSALVLQTTLYIAISTVLAASIILEELLLIAHLQLDVDPERYEVWNWKHWAFFHWIINPGVVVGELLFGQRVPKVMLIDKQSGKTLTDSTLVPCPHCGTIHDGRTWSAENKTAYKNWHGLYCPNCGGIIPCLENATSAIIKAILFPFTYLFAAGAQSRWLSKQPTRYENIKFTETDLKKVPWFKMGLIFGAAMYVIMTLLLPLITQQERLFGDRLWYWLGINLVIWLLAGLAFGRAMKWMLGPNSPMVKGKTKKPA